MSDTEVKTLPVEIYSSSKGYITYNPTKIDIIPVGSNIKQENSDENIKLTSPYRSNISKFPQFCYDTPKNYHYSNQFPDIVERYSTQNVSNVNENSYILPQNSANMNNFSTNYNNFLHSSNFKNIINGSTSKIVDPSSATKNFKDQNLDFNKQFSNSFSTIFKDTQNILNDVENHNKLDEFIENTSSSPYIKVEPENFTNEESAIKQNCFPHIFQDSYHHIRSGLSDGEYSTNSCDNITNESIMNKTVENEHLVKRDLRAERNKLKMRLRREILRQTESSEEKAARLLQLRDRARLRRKIESTDKRMERLKRDREKKRIYRAKLKQDNHYDEILTKNRILMRIRRQNEAFREKEKERDRIRHRLKRTNLEYREKERAKERERKKAFRSKKTCSEYYSGYPHSQFLQLYSMSSENGQNFTPSLLQTQ